MKDIHKQLEDYFVKLGLESDAATLYMALQAHGPQTISELARSSGIERIRIYRMLDDLQAAGVVEIESRYKRSIIHAASFSSLQVLLVKREQELQDLQQEYSQLSMQFSGREMHSRATRVQFYEGMDGIKQMLWGQTTAKSRENISILYDNMQNKTNATFFERWAQRCNERGLRFRGIVGDHFLKTQEAWYKTHTNERLAHWEARQIPETILKLEYSTVVYDDTILQYNWNSDLIFGIEIQNAPMARMYRQLFELVWLQAAPIAKT